MNVNLISEQYCLFFIDSWITCSTKSEWASWVQAIVVTLALLTAIIKLLFNRIKFYALFILNAHGIREYISKIDEIFIDLKNQDYSPDRDDYVYHIKRILRLRNPISDLIESENSSTPKIILKTNSIIEDLRQYLINLEPFIYSMSDNDIFGGTYDEILESIDLKIKNLKIINKQLISISDVLLKYNIFFRFF